MTSLIKIVLLVCVACSFASCSNRQSERSQVSIRDSLAQASPAPVINAGHTPVAIPGNMQDYYFEPDTSTISGLLKMEMFYGPPGYGDSPETDEKEETYILYLDSPVNVNQKPGAEDEFDVTTRNVKELQLAWAGELSLQPMVNKKIKITGTFFGQHTGHHHTSVLMAVSRAEAL